MPKLVYKPKRDIPIAVRTLRTFSPSKIREWILNRFNESVTPESITMWFKRHPSEHDALQKEVLEEEKPKEVILESIFKNGTFEQLESVNNWITEMKDRLVSEQRIKANVGALKRVCLGKFPKLNVDLVQEALWSYKHPDRLSIDEAREIVRILRDRGLETCNIRIPLRDFLLSKGIVVGKKISGAKSKGYGKFARLYVEKDILNKMLEWIKGLNFEAYVIDRFMFKTATRISATLNARIEDLTKFEDHAEIRVFDKARRSIHPKGKEWIKYIDPSLLAEINQIISDRKVGQIFVLTESEMAKINRSALETFCPELLKEYGDIMPNHFWRHMFAQHILRATDWNYGLVGELGGWTPKALEESYGKPPQAIVKEWGLKYMPVL